MRVLVCGGRDYRHEALLRFVLNTIHHFKPITMIIHGAAGKAQDGKAECGADLFAGEWAQGKDITEKPYPVTEADWKREGKKAGVLRNQKMLEEAKPDLVVAFPGGTGTNDMCERANRAGVAIRDLRW